MLRGLQLIKYCCKIKCSLFRCGGVDFLTSWIWDRLDICFDSYHVGEMSVCEFQRLGLRRRNVALSLSCKEAGVAYCGIINHRERKWGSPVHIQNQLLNTDWSHLEQLSAQLSPPAESSCLKEPRESSRKELLSQPTKSWAIMHCCYFRSLYTHKSRVTTVLSLGQECQELLKFHL